MNRGMTGAGHGGRTDALVIGISSRALFDMGESHAIFESKGLAAYSDYQVANEDTFLEPGVAFPLVRKLLALNDDLAGQPRVEVILAPTITFASSFMPRSSAASFSITYVGV